ncbi:putative gpi transamidase component pig-s protein [Teratosphaeria destructans]|uniref:Gpi transamidase component pig-s protein n=1 Tax=Teratosphaeria destructans TaxID=418781 RepID=A0A9W7SM59_9PEZI|nr:putative gpi transamidase component pig-s protein [Teratosphaeria destructans]
MSMDGWGKMSATAVQSDESRSTGSSAKAKKPEPPPESPGSEWKRRCIILGFWAVVIVLGLPHWIWTTSIHRSNLPLETMDEWTEGKTCQMQYPLRISLSIPTSSHEAVDVLARTVREKLSTHQDLPYYTFDVTAGPPTGESPVSSHGAYDLIVLVGSVQAEPEQAKLQSWAPVLDLKIPGLENVQVEELSTRLAQHIRRVFVEEAEAISYLLSDTPYAAAEDAQLSPERKALLDARTTRSFKYATTYHLTFSLFTSSASPSAWEIDEALAQYIKPLTNALSSISQFTIDTQVQLHASFSPSIAGPQYDEATGRWQLQKTDLSGFVNAAEWPLSPSIGGGPTIHFVLYIPSKQQTPLEIVETGGTSWLIPQWGGVQIFNPTGSQGEKLTAKDLEPVMLTFAEHLTSLVGLPPTPPSLALRIASLTRERATSLILSTSSTLGALARLTLKLTSIAIPDNVAKSVDETISRLDQACHGLRAGRFDEALESARIANDEAEKAFFDPSMVGQVYFPDEHKVAVYVPLLGPMAVPLVMAAMKELRKFRDARKFCSTRRDPATPTSTVIDMAWPLNALLSTVAALFAGQCLAQRKDGQYWPCNPTTNATGSCTPNYGLDQYSYSIDFTNPPSDLDDYWSTSDYANITYNTLSNNGAEFTFWQAGNAPQLYSNFYIFFGHVDVVLKVAPGTGMITSSVLLSDDFDEIDWEMSGNNFNMAQYYSGGVIPDKYKNGTVQNNYFGKGITGSYDRGQWEACTNPQTQFHTYSVDWTPTRVEWLIDGVVVRTLLAANADNTTHQFPQTPSRIQIGIWDGGAATEDYGTYVWAGGRTNVSQAPFTAYLKSISIKNYYPARYYNYTDQSGKWTSIKQLNTSLPASYIPSAAELLGNAAVRMDTAVVQQSIVVLAAKPTTLMGRSVRAVDSATVVAHTAIVVMGLITALSSLVARVPMAPSASSSTTKPTSVSSTKSSTSAVTGAVCMKYDGTTVADSNGESYAVICNTKNSGSVLSTVITATNIPECLPFCDKLPSCKAVMFHEDLNQCYLLSSIGSNTYADKYNLAVRQSAGTSGTASVKTTESLTTATRGATSSVERVTSAAAAAAATTADAGRLGFLISILENWAQGRGH